MARVEERIDVGFGSSPSDEVSAGPRPRGDLARLPWTSFFIIAVLILVAVLAPLIAPHSPTEQSLPDKLRPPAWQEGGGRTHLLGTDVPAEGDGPEQGRRAPALLPRGRAELVGQRLLGGRVGRDERRQHGDEDQDDDDEERGPRQSRQIPARPGPS